MAKSLVEILHKKVVEFQSLISLQIKLQQSLFNKLPTSFPCFFWEDLNQSFLSLLFSDGCLICQKASPRLKWIMSQFAAGTLIIKTLVPPYNLTTLPW